MRPPGRWLALSALVALLPITHACVRPATEPAPRLADLLRGYHHDVAPFHPFTASDRGLHEYDRMLANDIGEEYRSAYAGLCRRYQTALRGLDAAALDDDERLTYEVFADRLQRCLDGFRFPSHLIPIDQAGYSWPSRFPVVGSGRGNHPFKTPQNYGDFQGRVDGFVAWVDTAIANMRVGIARGVTQPRALMLKVLPQLDAQIVADPRASLFYEPIRNFPDSFDAPVRRALTDLYVDAIEHKIVPAYRRLRAFIQDEYLPHCRTTSGLGAQPDGHAWYAHAVRYTTTTSMTPTEIYELGRAEVTRIQAAMDALRAKIRADGDPPPPRYRLEELMNGYARLRVEVEAAVPRLFGRAPRAGLEIRPIEPFRERSMPTSYEPAALDGSRPGVFYLNVAGLRGGGAASVSRHLFLHEAVPGHHFQFALQRQNTALPDFRRFGWYVAFGEGWALYAESLGVEMGIYANRWDRLAMLGGELFRAGRLVVDVGIHDKGWTREEAQAYLGGASPDSEREVERYMAWPGQALGYKIGQLKFLALRRKAEATLGARFDVRAFHDELLRDGALPLGILEAKMDRWLARQQRGS